jgi:ribosome-associated translation inhibitor RaiA
MNLTIISPGLQINVELEYMMRNKFSNLDKLNNRTTGFEVIMRKIDTANEKNCEIEGRALTSKSSFICRKQAETFELALDQVVENLTRQLKWEKEERTEIW